MPMRARWPPENWCGKRRISVGSRPTRFSMQADVLGLLLRARSSAVRDRRLADDVDDAHPRIERRVRVLEDHLHLELLLARGRRVEARERHARASTARPRRAAAGRPPAGRASTCRTGFADEPHDFAGRRPRGRRRPPRGRPPRACRAPSALPIRAATSSDFTKRFDTPRSSTSAARSASARAVAAFTSPCDQRMEAAHASGRRRRLGAHRRATAVARRGAYGAALAERAARAAARAATASCRESASAAAPRSLLRRHRVEQALRVRMRGRPSTSLARALLDDAPRVHHADASASPAITDRSCVIQISAVPVSRASFCIS